jgi:hypothetical protein
MGQAISDEKIIVGRTRFEIDRKLVHWTLLLIPDAPSIDRLSTLLAKIESATGET